MMKRCFGGRVLPTRFGLFLVLFACGAYAQDNTTAELELMIAETEIIEHEDEAQPIVLQSDQPVEGDISVELGVSGTAQSGADFDLVTTIVIEDGEEKGEVLFSPIRDWDEDEGNETVLISVTKVTGDAELTDPDVELEITLVDRQIFPPTENPDDNDDDDGGGSDDEVDNDSPELIVSYALNVNNDRVQVLGRISNIGFGESDPTQIELLLATDLDLTDPVFSEQMDVPALSTFGIGFEAVFDIPADLLDADSTYYGRLDVAAVEGDFDLNNQTYLGFQTDARGLLLARCAASDADTSGEGQDPLLEEQWYIKNVGFHSFAYSQPQIGVDINMDETIAAGITGKGVEVAVVDTGLEICHPELAPAVKAGASFNWASNRWRPDYIRGSSRTDPFNTDIFGDHGTSVAGVIAAAADNNYGIRGVAPGVSLRGYNFLITQLEAAYAGSLGMSNARPKSDDVHVFNLSFGTTAWVGLNELETEIYASGVSNLRDGLGGIYVKAAGNEFGFCPGSYHPVHAEIGCQGSNSDPVSRTPYTIVVAAHNADGFRSSYSSSGAVNWVTGPAGEFNPFYPQQLTTDQSTPKRGYHLLSQVGLHSDEHRDRDAHGDFISEFGGTSGAAPVVTGAVALLLEVNPQFTWRDIKHILASSSWQMDPDIERVRVAIGGIPYILQDAWLTNAAGFRFHNWYGFGALDVDAAVNMAQGMTPGELGEFQTTDWVAIEYEKEEDYIAIPDADGGGVTFEIEVVSPRADPDTRDEEEDEAFKTANIEALQIEVSVRHGRLRDLGTTVISPSGTRSVVDPVLSFTIPGTIGFDTFDWLSNAFYGESPLGTWKIQIVDALPDVEGHIRSVALRSFYGDHPETETDDD